VVCSSLAAATFRDRLAEFCSWRISRRARWVVSGRDGPQRKDGAEGEVMLDMRWSPGLPKAKMRCILRNSRQGWYAWRPGHDQTTIRCALA